MVGQATNRKDLLKSSGNTADIISAILYADSQSASYTKELATQLQKPTVLDTCRAIYDFVKQNIEYKEDPDGFQFVQSPGHLYWGDKSKGNGQGDCKSMSVFCGSILQNLGIKYAFRFVSQDRSKDLHHVFIVVPNEIGKPICLDCVDENFNAHYNFTKVKDIVPQQCLPASNIGRIGDAFALYSTNQSSSTGVIKNFGKDYASWSDYLIYTEYPKKCKENYEIAKGILLNKIKNDWDSVKIWSAIEPISSLLLGAKGNQKVNGYFEEILDKGGLTQLMYSYWDDTRAPFPAALAAKKEQSILFKNGLITSKINTRITAGFKDKTKPPYFDEFNLHIFCDWHCFVTYGLPLPVLLEKAYNMALYGTDFIPIHKIPYYSLTNNNWVRNGALQKDWDNLARCIPFDGTKIKKYRTPYWTAGGFIMPNGAYEKTFTDFKKNTPLPGGLTAIENIATVKDPLADQIYLINWWEETIIKSRFEVSASAVAAQNYELAGRPFVQPTAAQIDAQNNELVYTPPTTGSITPSTSLIPITAAQQSAQDAELSGKHKIGNPVVIAIIGAVVSVLTSLISMICKLIDKKKTDEQIKNDLVNYPVDFKNSYETVDGCTMEATNTNGQVSYTKHCPDGTVTPNANPNDPANQPANGVTGLLGNLKSAWPLMLAAAGIGLLLLFSSSSKKSKA